MGMRAFAGVQTVSGAAQPLFGTSLTAAATPPPDQFSNNLNPGSNETQVTDDTPPTFIVASKPDSIVPVKNSELFYQALQRHGVKSEFLELPKGEHGFGLGKKDPEIGRWTDACLAWMTKQGFMKPASSKPG